jgi:molecular chaperone DnaK (HSP70)
MKDKKREQLKKFLQLSAEQDTSAKGEDAIERWSEIVERDNDYFNLYKLDETDKQQIKDIVSEYRTACELEITEREQRRDDDKPGEEIIANHYADRIKKISTRPNILRYKETV